jgi:hypothetical protein
MIIVKSNTKKLGNRVAIFEQDERHPPRGKHPGGDVSIHGDREYTVFPTGGIEAAIHDGRLIKVKDLPEKRGK